MDATCNTDWLAGWPQSLYDLLRQANAPLPGEQQLRIARQARGTPQ